MDTKSPFFNTSSGKKPVRINSSILESLRDLTGGVGHSAVTESTRAASEAISSILGAPIPRSGELKANQVLDFSARKQSIEDSFYSPEAQPQPHGYSNPEIRHTPHSREEIGLKQKIAEVRQELVLLAASMKKLDQNISKAISEKPATPGVYHLNFYDRLKALIKLFRKEVDQSSNWLGLQQARGKRKTGYWSNYKKHGTQWGLSYERTAATSSG